MTTGVYLHIAYHEREMSYRRNSLEPGRQALPTLPYFQPGTPLIPCGITTYRAKQRKSRPNPNPITANLTIRYRSCRLEKANGDSFLYIRGGIHGWDTEDTGKRVYTYTAHRI